MSAPLPATRDGASPLLLVASPWRASIPGAGARSPNGRLSTDPCSRRGCIRCRPLRHERRLEPLEPRKRLQPGVGLRRRRGDDVDTGRPFMGLVMGDPSKRRINTMFNTGTVVGVFPPTATEAGFRRAASLPSPGATRTPSSSPTGSSRPSAAPKPSGPAARSRFPTPAGRCWRRSSNRRGPVRRAPALPLFRATGPRPSARPRG